MGGWEEEIKAQHSYECIGGEVCLPGPIIVTYDMIHERTCYMRLMASDAKCGLYGNTVLCRGNPLTPPGPHVTRGPLRYIRGGGQTLSQCRVKKWSP